MNIWELSPKQIQDLQGKDGGPFRDFVNKVIRAHAATWGIRSSAISTDDKNMRDGGVDCQVAEKAGSDTTGRLCDQTCWQYKASPHGSVTKPTFRKEINKPYCKKLIKEGYANRFCIADTLTSNKKADWEQFLYGEIVKINPNSPRPQILTSTCLAEWASHFSAITLKYAPVSRFLIMDSWGKSITNLTRKYVQVKEWSVITEQIREHVNFTNSNSRLNYPIHADAGTGKTRLVYETLAKLEEAKSLVIYTSDEDSTQNFAHYLANQSDRFAILVIDDCSLESRHKVEQLLVGCKERVRVITVANYTRTGPSLEPSLRRMSNETVTEIIEVNYPDVSDELRRAAVALAGGFVKIAADICLNGISNWQCTASDYYWIRITDEEARKVIEAISLCKKVGFRGEVAEQFTDLCQLVGLSVDSAKEKAKNLKEFPGFVVIAGRYFYVTPEAIAQIALQNAWNRWIQDNTDDFFSRIPDSLLDEIQSRVANSGGSEFRNAMARYFERWASELRPEALGDKKKCERLVALVDTNPSVFLPTLVRLAELATLEELQLVTGYGTRRSLVWLCEGLSGFPDYFYDVEKILLRLAMYETEPGIGNNATEIWMQLFAVLLSGSSLPYLERLSLLESRLFSKNSTEEELAFRALGGIFKTNAFRMVGPPVVAGQIPPPNWRPTTNKENLECFNSAFDLYERIIVRGSKELREHAVEFLIERIYWFLHHGFLDRICDLLRPSGVPISKLPKALNEIDLFLDSAARGKEETKSQEYIKRVEDWKSSLMPNDLHSRLVSVVGRQFFLLHEDQREQQHRKQIIALAEEFLANTEQFKRELPWITSEEAKSAATFGSEIGRLDTDAKLFDAILSQGASNLSLHRGYLFGLISTHPEKIPKLNTFLDRLEEEEPLLAFEYAATMPNETQGFHRWMRLCDAGRVPAHYVRSLIFGIGVEHLGIEHLKEALPRLLNSLSTSSSQTSAAALELTHRWVNHRKGNNVRLAIKDKKLWKLISRLLTDVVPNDTMSAHYLKETLQVFCEINPKAGAKIAGLKLLCDDFSLDDDAEHILITLSHKRPDLVMHELGRILLKEKEAWKIQIRGCRSILVSLPPKTVVDWLEKTGVKGALSLAGSLPRPFIDQDGEPNVPTVTYELLSHFGSNEKVVRAFIVGSGVRSYEGNIAAKKLEEAEIAKKFLNHPLTAIREWARVEKLGSEREAKHWQQEDEERFL